MRVAFWTSFGLAFVACLATMSVAGGTIAWSLVKPLPERFATSTFSFDLPPGWSCDLKGDTYECNAGKPPWSALVVIALKMRNGADNLATYEATLRAMPTSPGHEGSRLVSLRRRLILGSPWVEGVLMGSEVKNYQTIYLAGTTSELGILITLSVHKDALAARMHELDSMVGTLVVNQRAIP